VTTTLAVSQTNFGALVQLVEVHARVSSKTLLRAALVKTVSGHFVVTPALNVLLQMKSTFVVLMLKSALKDPVLLHRRTTEKSAAQLIPFGAKLLIVA
jgi:hypothetical protein